MNKAIQNDSKKTDLKNNYYKAYDERYKKVHEEGILWELTDPSPVVEKFLKLNKASSSSKILDLGCGEGRDAIYLLDKGYNVFAVDYSQNAIDKCNELTNNIFKKNFKQLDLFDNNLKTKYDFIYSISVLHMFVLDEHRIKFFEFIYNHLKKNGKALVTVLGDGIKEKKSDINEAFLIKERTIQKTNKKINVTSTSCRIVDWNTLEFEVLSNKLTIEKKWISNEIPGFSESMCVIVIKNKE